MKRMTHDNQRISLERAGFQRDGQAITRLTIETAEGVMVDVLLSPTDRDCLANELRFGDSTREQVD